MELGDSSMAAVGMISGVFDCDIAMSKWLAAAQKIAIAPSPMTNRMAKRLNGRRASAHIVAPLLRSRLRDHPRFNHIEVISPAKKKRALPQRTFGDERVNG